METKFRAGKILIPVTVERNGQRLELSFRYNKILLEEIKTRFEKRRWHGTDDVDPRKVWSIPITQRNLFVIEDLQDRYGSKPYSIFDLDYSSTIEVIEKYCKSRDLKPYKHQVEMIAQGLTVKQFIWGAEMGTGKSLAAIILMEMSGFTDWIWVGPKSALRAVDVEMYKWKAKIIPKFYTYEGLKKLITEWPEGKAAPMGVIFDEASKIKTPTAARSIAAKHLADSIRSDHSDYYIGLMSGTPAPKSPIDWWHLNEVACPGFLKESNIYLFKQRLGIIEQRENIQGGGVYPYLVTWLDDENKCAKCGQIKEQHSSDHEFIKSINEVANLHKRMRGLVLIKFKNECLDLPEKVYDIIYCQPTKEIKETAKLIAANSVRAIEALTLLRELSDGFQYTKKIIGSETCPLCRGTKISLDWFDPNDPDATYINPDAVSKGVRFIYDSEDNVIGEEKIEYKSREIECVNCFGTGLVGKFERGCLEVPTPKEEILREQLENHEEHGRFVTYAGFTGSIDRIVRICHNYGWTTIRADGRGWQGITPTAEILPDKLLLRIFDQGHQEYPKICFIGQPGAAGMGLNLTASPTTFFWSNTFNGEDRMQAEDRGHRPGMMERGGRIVDVIHLDTDNLVLENLKKKKDLQKLSMTGIKECLF